MIEKSNYLGKNTAQPDFDDFWNFYINRVKELSRNIDLRLLHLDIIKDAFKIVL